MSRKRVRLKDRRHLVLKIQMGIIVTIFILGIVIIIWNASGLKTVLRDSTAQYVQDVAYQQASGIMARFDADRQTLEQVAERIPQMKESELKEYLEETGKEIGFDQLLVWNREELAETDLRDDQGETIDLFPVFEGEISLSYGAGQRVYFGVPIREEDQINRVLLGVREQSSMQTMIQPKSFGGSGLSCVVNRYGKVILSPTELKPFLQLDDIFTQEGDNRTGRDIRQMKQNMERNQAGAFRFTAVDGTELILSYQPIERNGWILLTLVPAELIAGNADAYIFRTFLIIGVITGASAWMLALIIVTFRRNRRQLEKSAFVDPLTGGMNNAAFQQSCRRMLEQKPPSTCTVILLNVRDFKLINEFFGISAGNDILRYIYQTLQEYIRPGELVARGEADNFFLCLEEADPEIIQQRLEKMTGKARRFRNSGDERYVLSFQEGAYLVEDPSVEVPIIQDRARIACQRQNRSDQCMFYSRDLTETLRREQELAGRFEQALESGEFQIFLQPKVRLKDRCIGGAEALVRWMNPQEGMISPGDFIPVFERNGSICKLDLYVFEQVCVLMRRWKEEGRPDLPVSVNLSRVHFRNPDFLRPFCELKDKYQIPDGMLELEVTESIFFDDAQIKMVKRSIGEIHACGLNCSLDDFGMGFSSLGLLKEFDVDAIKLDRRFFDDMESEKSWKVIESFMELPGKLGMGAVAEGIETEEQLELLQKTDCQMVQGYVFSKPLCVEAFEQWWETHRPRG